MGRPATIKTPGGDGEAPLAHPSNPCEILSRMSPGTLQELVADVVAAGTRQAAKAADPHSHQLEIAVQPPWRNASLVVNAALKP